MSDAKIYLMLAFNAVALFNFFITFRQLYWLHVSTKRLFTPMMRGPSKHTLRFVLGSLVRSNLLVSLTIFAGVFALLLSSDTSIFHPQILITLSVTFLSVILVAMCGLKFLLDSRKFT